ncbi:hypothetical protein JR316_0005583 [Psilocybe cubensis]|uniref:F-box domain-containing protein n=2 Tax=Psilocybe cubensis TaxID=181762 RepID=A0A8H7Y2B2_PSICU|nr:hypothetical protein JR316_0005583 [Psilocybe cubensis]KAH9481064.1 hypothetical protein JR316_0005583 [Psilocybe cubensis]
MRVAFYFLLASRRISSLEFTLSQSHSLTEMSSSTTNNLPLFPFDVFSQIFKECDLQTLQTCSTLSKDMHECALPFLFQTISFRANRPSLVNIPQEERDNICSGAIQRFTELPKMRVAAFVRRLVYEGCRFPDTDARQHYHRRVWAVFRVTLSPTVYIGLTELILTSVDIDFQDAQGISTLEALRLLYLVNVRLSDGVVLGGRLRPKVLHFSTPGQLVNTSANAILGVCKEVRWLQLHRLPRAPDILYKILEVTPSLTDLHITLERPVNNDQLGAPALESRFCPRLSVYSGPFYYSAIINGRPVWHIDVHEFPESMSYEGPRLWTSQAILEGSSASVMVFKLRKWPAEFCEIFFELVWDHFPHIRELTIELSAYYNTTPDENHADNISMYNLDIESVKNYHYLVRNPFDSTVIPQRTDICR